MLPRSTSVPASTWPRPAPRRTSPSCARLSRRSMPEGMVDWNLAERVAGALGGSGPSWDGNEAELRAESDRAAELVRDYTGLKPKGQMPPAELVDRAEWAQVNLESFRGLSTKVEEHLEQRMEHGKGGGGL